MRLQDSCVVHVASVGEVEALETLCRTVLVIAAVGMDQILLLLDKSEQADLRWLSTLPVQIKPLRFGTARAMQSELARLAGERLLYAVHLHGARPCLLGSRALKGTPLQGRALYSPHLTDGRSSWTAALLSRLLQNNLDPQDGAAVTASLTEAEALSRLLKRSAEVLPLPVSEIFFRSARRESTLPCLVADGSGSEAVRIVTRLAVLLNGRAARVALRWLGVADAKSRAQLEAAGIQPLDESDDSNRAHILSEAWAYVHLSADGRLPQGVVQAMAAGLPCLVSDTSVHRSLIRHGETGFVCTAERDLLEKLILLFRDPRERRRMGEAARAEAGQRFTAFHFERAILRAYGFSNLVTAKAGSLQAISAGTRT